MKCLVSTVTTCGRPILLSCDKQEGEVRHTRLILVVGSSVALMVQAGCGSESSPVSPVMYANGTIKITRMAEQVALGKIWTEEGTSTVISTATVAEFKDGGVIVVGEGTGKAGYDATGGGCVDVGEWHATYAVTGFVDTDPNCRLDLQIVTKWTRGTAFAVCFGMSNSMNPPDYSETFTVRFDNNANIAFSTNPGASGAMTWSNKVELSSFTAGRCGFIRTP
jgi:hypothetical protein